jgi:phospholipid transport system substrate-binding protein
MLKRILASALLAFTLYTPAQATVDTADPFAMVQKVADNTFKRVTADQSIISTNKEHLRVIVEDELLPYIDYKYAAYRVLGSYIQKVRTIEDAKEKQQAVENIKTFIEVFKRYLVATYAGVFTQYTNQKVEFLSDRDFASEDIAIVRTRIVEQGKPDISIDFKVRRDKDNQWRAYDMMAEGISLLDAKQTELHGILRQQGIEYVIELLDKKSKLPIQFRGKDGNE